MPRSVNSSFIASRALAEESERRGGGRREAELHRTASVGREGAGHERELVERERPHDAGRHQEGDAANAAVCDVVEELAVPGGAALVDEGQRVGKDREPIGAERHHELVVALVAGIGDGKAPVDVHAAQATQSERRAVLLAEGGCRVASDRPQLEGLGDRQGPVDELLVRGEHGDLDLVAREIAQGEHELEAGNAAAGDEHLPALGCGIEGHDGGGDPTRTRSRGHRRPDRPWAAAHRPHRGRHVVQAPARPGREADPGSFPSTASSVLSFAGSTDQPAHEQPGNGDDQEDHEEGQCGARRHRSERRPR